MEYAHAQNQNLGEIKRKEGVCANRFSSKVCIMNADALLFRKQLNICLPVGSSEEIPYFALILHAEFALPNLSTRFSFLFSPPSYCSHVNEQAALWVLSCWQESTHRNYLFHPPAVKFSYIYKQMQLF